MGIDGVVIGPAAPPPTARAALRAEEAGVVLEAVAAAARRAGASYARVRLDGLEVEVDLGAPAPARPIPAPVEEQEAPQRAEPAPEVDPVAALRRTLLEVGDDTRCPGCGHSLEIEHGAAGCLRGCSAEVCESRNAAAEVAQSE